LQLASNREYLYLGKMKKGGSERGLIHNYAMKNLILYQRAHKTGSQMSDREREIKAGRNVPEMLQEH
jgi:hypothetical protein